MEINKKKKIKPSEITSETKLEHNNEYRTTFKNY